MRKTKKSDLLSKRLRRVESRNVTFVGEGFPVFWERASGSYVTDIDGNKYLDFSSGFGVMALGHSSPIIRKAMEGQARKMWHGMGDVHPNAVKVELQETLAAWAPKPLSVSILSSSGSEAVESALKTARLYTSKPGVIAFKGAYHGLSYGTLGLTDRLEFSGPFRDQIAATVAHLPFPDPLHGPTDEVALKALEHFLRTVGRVPAGPVGAILIEPVQGRGGIRIASKLFMRGLRDISKRFGLVFIADEVMTGFGRTGVPFAVSHSGVVPDLLCVGKALANGFPISACIGRPEIMAAWPPSDGEALHTSTFLGNPLGCAMALAFLQEAKRRNLAHQAATLGHWWLDDLRSALLRHPRVGDIRGVGLMVGIEFVRDKKYLAPDPQWTAKVMSDSLKSGLILLSGGTGRNILTLTPPLTISKAELHQGTQILKDVLFGKAHPSDL